MNAQEELEGSSGLLEGLNGSDKVERMAVPGDTTGAADVGQCEDMEGHSWDGSLKQTAAPAHVNVFHGGHVHALRTIAMDAADSCLLEPRESFRKTPDASRTAGHYNRNEAGKDHDNPLEGGDTDHRVL